MELSDLTFNTSVVTTAIEQQDEQFKVYLDNISVSDEIIKSTTMRLYDRLGLLPPKNIVFYDSPNLIPGGLTTHALLEGHRHTRNTWIGVTGLGFLVSPEPLRVVEQQIGQDKKIVNSEIKFMYQDSPFPGLVGNFAVPIKELRSITGGFILGKNDVTILRRPRIFIENDRLHNTEGKAVVWPNGYGYHFIYGVSFSETMFKKITAKKMSVKEVLKIRDVDQRSIAIKYMDPEKMIKALGAKIVSSGIKRHYKWSGRKIERTKKTRSSDITTQNILYKTNYFDDQRLPRLGMGRWNMEWLGGTINARVITAKYFLYYKDPSTGKPYISFCTEGVRERGEDADAVMAWKHHLTKDQYIKMYLEA